MKKCDYTADAERILRDAMCQASRDGAVDVCLWVMHNIKLTQKDYNRLNDYLDKEYDFNVHD